VIPGVGFAERSVFKCRFIVNGYTVRPEFICEQLLGAPVVTGDDSVMPIGVDFSFEAVLRAIYALCHSTIAYSAH
jgi:hypothetical protein